MAGGCIASSQPAPGSRPSPASQHTRYIVHWRARMRALRSLRTAGAAVAIAAVLAAGSIYLFASDAPAEEGADPAQVAIGERLFLESRFAQFFFANAGGNPNATLAIGDPVMDATVATGSPFPGAFTGASMNCRACHLVDEHSGTAGAGNRTYADFARRSPVPAREDGRTVTPRNSPPLVNAALPRPGLLLHFDGEFPAIEDLVRETLLGRNFGWLPAERAQAIAHIARVIRGDDGQGALALQFGGAYSVVLKATDPAIPREFRLPKAFRINAASASDGALVDVVARLVAAYVRSLTFARDEAGLFSGSPYDAFLRKNGLPRAPRAGESDLEYSRRLRSRLET